MSIESSIHCMSEHRSKSFLNFFLVLALFLFTAAGCGYDDDDVNPDSNLIGSTASTRIYFHNNSCEKVKFSYLDAGGATVEHLLIPYDYFQIQGPYFVDTLFTVNTDNGDDEKIDFNWIKRHYRETKSKKCIEFKTSSSEENFNVAALVGDKSYSWVKDGHFHNQIESRTEDRDYYFILTEGEGNIYAWGTELSVLDPHSRASPS